MGEYLNDRKNGRGILSYANGDAYDGTFFNDQKDGEGATITTEGEYIKQFWSMGRL